MIIDHYDHKRGRRGPFWHRESQDAGLRLPTSWRLFSASAGAWGCWDHVLAQHAEKINNLNLYDQLTNFWFWNVDKVRHEEFEELQIALLFCWSCKTINVFDIGKWHFRKIWFWFFKNLNSVLFDFTIKVQVGDFRSRLCLAKAFPLLVFIFFQKGCNFFWWWCTIFLFASTATLSLQWPKKRPYFQNKGQNVL